LPTILAHPFAALALSPLLRDRHGVAVRRVIGLGALCTVIPDLDVVGLWIGVPYGALFGHRGFTHSLFFAVLLGLLLSRLPFLASDGRGRAMVALFLAACTASHGLLDALTDGGLGIAFLSPFSNARYFLPWQPIAVSPLDLAAFTGGRGWRVLGSEAVVVVLPALALAAFGWRRRRRDHANATRD
jgi:inner membrane protein